MANGKVRDSRKEDETRPQTPSSKALQKLNEPLRPNTSLNRANRLGEMTEDEQLLRKPHTRHDDFTHSDTWRVLRITGEFVNGFDTLASVGAAVTCFGSARVHDDDPMYWKGVELAKRLAEEGFAIITGGGPGMMEAANRGAKEANGISIGCNIELPFEQGTNAYVDVSINFRYFFVRKTMFMKYSEGFVIFPGGFGTMDELFEALTLVQTGKVRNFPLVLFGKEYWGGLIDWIKGPMLKECKIAEEDLKLLIVTDSVDEAARIIIDAYKELAAQGEDANSEASRVHSELLDEPGPLQIPKRNSGPAKKAAAKQSSKEPRKSARTGKEAAAT